MQCYAQSDLAHLDIILGQGSVVALRLTCILALLRLLHTTDSSLDGYSGQLGVQAQAAAPLSTVFQKWSGHASLNATSVTAIKPYDGAVLPCLTIIVKLYWLFSSLMPMITVPRLAAFPARWTPSGGLQKGIL